MFEISLALEDIIHETLCLLQSITLYHAAYLKGENDPKAQTILSKQYSHIQDQFNKLESRMSKFSIQQEQYLAKWTPQK